MAIEDVGVLFGIGIPLTIAAACFALAFYHALIDLTPGPNAQADETSIRAEAIEIATVGPKVMSPHMRTARRLAIIGTIALAIPPVSAVLSLAFIQVIITRK